MVLKQKGKPEKGKKPLRGQPREFSDHRDFPDGPREEEDSASDSNSEEESSGSEVESSTPQRTSSSTQAVKKTPSTSTSNAPNEMSRRDREAIQKEQARQHYMKMKEKEDGARLALIRKEREEAAAAHAEALRAKEAAKRR